MSNNLPERINVMKVITYDVQNIVESLTENDETPRVVTLEEVMEVIDGWVKDDFACGYGHEADTRNLIFQDENGEEV